MKTENFTREDLALIQEEKGAICISIIVPTHRLSPERRADPLQLEKAINSAKKYLASNYIENEIKPLANAINELYQQVDFNHNEEGIGLFVSAGIKKLFRFSFPVKEKVIISNTFETRDLLYQAYLATPYFVLLLNGKEAKFFRGSIQNLQEINDGHFPKKFEDDYEYSRPTRGSSYAGYANTKGFERDKSQLEDMRFEDFLGTVDEDLNSYLINKTPLVVAGAQKDISGFKKVTRHTKNIAGLVPGNYSYAPVSELGGLAWNIIKTWLDGARENLVRDFEEKIGEGRGITGIGDVWKAAKEGRGLQLLVEKDYSLPGFLINGDDYNLLLRPPHTPHQVLPDAVNSAIETVLEKNGEVILVENNALSNHRQIALVTRY